MIIIAPFAGRPKEDNPKGKIVTVRFTDDEIKKLDEHVKKKNTTKSKFIRKSVIESIEQDK